MLQNWNISLDTLTPFLHQPEVQHLLGWITAFQKQCDEKKWITASALPKWIQNHNDRLSLPEKIMLMGFDDLHPAIKSLFSLLEKKCVIETETLSAKTPEKKQVILDNTKTEIKTAALWLKTQWEKNPRGLFGCVIPELEKMRTTVQHIFSDF